MALALLAPLRDLLALHAGDAAGQVVTRTVTVFLAVVATAFLVAAGLVALSAAAGFTVAALVFSALFAVFALVVHLLGRRRAARRAIAITAAQNRAKADIALATALSRSTRPLLPLAAFLAAFALARRP